jgi:hypothetical protein
VDLVRREREHRPDPQPPQDGVRGRLDDLAPEGQTMDASDSDQQRLPEERRASRDGELDDVPDAKAANRLVQLDIINALLLPQRLDVFNLDGVSHDGPSTKVNTIHG